MAVDIKDVECNRCLRVLNTILERWTEANIELARLWCQDGDVPWWYNERANLSVLAGAIWRAGGLVFEEFLEEKRKITKTGKLSMHYRGRVDLYFCFSGYQFIAESKRIESGILKDSEPVGVIQRSLNMACRDIRKVRPFKQRRLGITFALPYLRKGQFKSADERIARWLRETQSVDCDARAWVFPGISRAICDKEFVCPGVAVFMKEIG